MTLFAIVCLAVNFSGCQEADTNPSQEALANPNDIREPEPSEPPGGRPRPEPEPETN